MSNPLPTQGKSDGRSGAQDSTSRGRAGFRLTAEQVACLPWERLPAILTLSEAAVRSRLSSWSLRQGIHSGKLPAVAIGKRLLIPRDDLRSWLDAGRTAPR